jgi:hypothetical protein
MLAANPGPGDLYAPPSSAAGAASPSAPYYAPPSGSVDSAEQYAGASDAYKRALIRFNQQRTGLLRQYGYAGDINPDNGMVQNLRVDGTNTHGALQELLGTQAGEDQNALYAAEDRGLHGGLANQAETSLHSAHSGQTSRLGQSLFGGLSDLDSQQLDAHSTLDQALWQLTHSATTNAIDNNDYNPAGTSDGAPDYSGGYGGGGDGGGSVPPAKTVQGRLPARAVAKLLTAATNRGEPTSEHGLGSMGNPKVAALAKKAVANAYTNGKKKRG